MLKVGLTGGIGSGKTFVANIFAHLGIPVYYADAETKQLYNTDVSLIQQLRDTFGGSIFEGNILNKKALAAIAFADSKALSALNALVHPAVEKRFNEWVKNQNSPYVIQEAAILFESGFNKLMDKVIVVTAPEGLRINRVIKRDGVSEDDIRKRMQHQLPQAKLISLADFTITANDATPMLPQVLAIHNQLLKLSENGLR
ncbi:MAG: dephospho-CoA kinase [Prevotellaceae bacterium]|jgi:dephospho-CoA kinase|nr:dephospho-CoA kinase [Prevotellaceae bacterium]